MGKTIKQLADELGVSKTTIRKYWKRLPQTLSETVCGTVSISDEGVTLIKSMFSQKTSETVSDVLPQTVSALVSALQAENEYLKTQNSDLVRLLDQQQQLQAQFQAEKQLLLESTKPQEETKKSLFARLFGG